MKQYQLLFLIALLATDRVVAQGIVRQQYTTNHDGVVLPLGQFLSIESETYTVDTNAGANATIDLLIFGGTTNRAVFKSGILTSNIVNVGTNWMDSMVPSTSVQLGATAPSLEVFNSGSSVLAFNNNQDDTVHFSLQLNHNYKVGTPIYPHVHWSEMAATGAGTNVVFELVYEWAAIGSVFPPAVTQTITNSVSGTNFLHKLSSFTPLTNSAPSTSSVLLGRLRRLASSATADNYDQNVAFLGFDCHYQVDGFGSDYESSKSY